MSLPSIKIFMLYVLIGFISKIIFENQISFFIATFLSENNSPKELIKNIIFINILMYIWYF